MTLAKTITIKGETLPPITTRTLTGSQLSRSGNHLSSTGSGIRELLERDTSVVEPDAVVAVTQEMGRPSFTKTKKRA